MCIHHLMSNAAWAKSEESSATGLTRSRDATLRSNSLMVGFKFDFIFMISLTSLLRISSGNVFALGLNFGFSTDASGKTSQTLITSLQKGQPEGRTAFFAVFSLRSLVFEANTHRTSSIKTLLSKNKSAAPSIVAALKITFSI